MLKCRIKKGSRSRFQVNGTVGDLANETCLLVNQIYTTIKKQAPEAAEAYKHRLLVCMLAPDSPVWKEDSHEN